MPSRPRQQQVAITVGGIPSSSSPLWEALKGFLQSLIHDLGNPDSLSPASFSLMMMPQPPQEHLLLLSLRWCEQVCHGVRDAIQHPPRALQHLLIGFEPMPAAQIVERQSLALGFFDLSPYPCQRGLVFLMVLPRADHRLISSGVPVR